MSKPKITAKTIRELLRKHHASQDWCLIFEVRDATGFKKASNSYADAIAMNTWPSKGFLLHGYEIKVSRSDWKKEMATLGKNDPFLKLVDYWWLVCPARVANESEIPPTWGWMQASETRLNIVRDAPRLTSAADPMPREFVASLLRKRRSQDVDFQEAIAQVRLQALDEAKRSAEYRQRQEQSAGGEAIQWRKDLAKIIGDDEFGLMMSGPEVTGRRLQAAFKLVRRLDNSYGLRGLDQAIGDVSKAVDQFKVAIGEIENG